MGDDEAREAGEIGVSVSEAMKWIRACRMQVDRFVSASIAAFHHDLSYWERRDLPTDWEMLEQAHTEGYFLVMAADQLRATLAAGRHADLLDLLPLPWYVDGSNPGAATVGADYVRHVRNANEHDDEKGLFVQSYGFSHRFSRNSSEDPLDANVSGLELKPFAAALDPIAEELERRRAEARRRAGLGG